MPDIINLAPTTPEATAALTVKRSAAANGDGAGPFANVLAQSMDATTQPAADATLANGNGADGEPTTSDVGGMAATAVLDATLAVMASIAAEARSEAAIANPSVPGLTFQSSEVTLADAANPADAPVSAASGATRDLAAGLRSTRNLGASATSQVAPEEPVALATPPATQGAAPRTTNRTSTDAISTTAALNRLDEVSESVAAPLLPRQASGHDVHASDAQATPFTSLATQASIAYGAQAPEFTPSRMTLDIQTPLRSPAWPIDLGHVVRLMSRDAVAEADLRITPPELGPIEIRLAIDGDTASIQFAAPTAETRALLETHMPKLREVLESTGLTLSGATVQSGFQRDTRQSSTGDGNGRSGDARDRGADEASDSVRVVGTLRRAEGLVDVFA